MMITESRLVESFSRDMFWATFTIFSNDRTKNTQVFACASYEFLQINMKERFLDINTVVPWIDAVRKRIFDNGDKIFEKETHYFVYSMTEEGEMNGYEFLKNRSKK